MELNRRETVSFLLLLFGHCVAAIVLPGDNNETDLHLECTNDYDTQMLCQMKRPNCTEYSLTLLSNDGYGVKHGTFQQCDSERCCSSVKFIPIPGETHTATVWKGGRSLKSETIDVTESIKPKTPTIISVIEINGNFEVKWDTHHDGVFSESLTAEVSYRVNGSTEKTTVPDNKATRNGLNFYEIPGQGLKPNTTYMVSVRSLTDWSGKFSDSSTEWEFKTQLKTDLMQSSNSLLLIIIITLSVAAVILTGAIYGCYVKVKTKWWDPVAKYPKSDLLIFPSSKQEVSQVLKPEPPFISSISVDPQLPDDNEQWSKMSVTDTSGGSFQQSSGISTGSSCLSYANTERVDIIACVKDALCKDIPGISPISMLTTSPLAELNKDCGLISSPISLSGIGADGMSSGSSGFDNKTYSILMPHQNVAGSSGVQVQPEIFCDPAYRPSESNTVNCPDQLVPGGQLPWQQELILPPVVPTDMSYQQCNADSGSFSNAEDSSLCSISSGINTTASCDVLSRAVAGNESSDKTNGKSEEPAICAKIPCSSFVPAESHSFLAVDNDYQAFQNLVGQPDVLFSEQRGGKQEEPLTNILQSSVVPGFFDKTQTGQNLSELHTPFLSMMSAGQSVPIIIDSGYQCV